MGKWFGVITCLVLLAKAVVNLKCLLFTLGLPGIFGRNFLIYADNLNDNSDKPIYNIQTNPIMVLLHTLLVVLKLIFIAPFQWLLTFCRFYTRKHDSPKEIIKRLSATNIRAEQKETKKVEKEAKALETEVNGDDAAVKNGDAAVKNGDAKRKNQKRKRSPRKEEKKEEPKSTPLV